MSVAQSFTPQTVRVSERAVDRLKALLTDENNPDLRLRVYVTGGGCSGFQYGFNFEEQPEEDDTCIEQDGVQVLIDPLSYQYLVGSEVDYREDLDGARFFIDRKSTRLNSSHVAISYAVFCVKKKTKVTAIYT